MKKREFSVIGVLAALALVITFLLGNPAIIRAQEKCFPIHIRTHAGIEPQILEVAKGDCVVWINWAREENVKVIFREGKKCVEIAGFGLPFMAPSVSAFVAMNYPPHLVGSMIGLWFGIGTLGGALGIYLAGVATAMTGNFDWSIRLISLAAAAGFLVGFTLRPRVGRKIGLISS